MRVRVAAVLFVLSSACEDVQRRPPPIEAQFESAAMFDAQRSAQDFAVFEEFPRDEYPPGPYGVEVESILANYAFESPEGVITIDQLRRDPSIEVLWIVHAAPWCPACQREIPDLPGLHAELRDQGLEILGVVSSNMWGDLPRADDAVQTFPDPPFPVAADPHVHPSLVEDQWAAGMGSIPLNSLVDLDTVRVRANVTGWSEVEMVEILDYVLDE